MADGSLTPPILFHDSTDVVLLRDVIERHGVANITALRWLVRHLLGSPASPFSVTKFSADLKSQGISVSREPMPPQIAKNGNKMAIK